MVLRRCARLCHRRLSVLVCIYRSYSSLHGLSTRYVKRLVWSSRIERLFVVNIANIFYINADSLALFLLFPHDSRIALKGSKMYGEKAHGAFLFFY